MVHVDKRENMGQVGLCGASSPQIDSLSYPSNGASSDVQASLTSLLAGNSLSDPEELVRKLCSILNENYELKETITQNNLAIKHQLGLLERWSQQVDLQQQQHKQALADSNKHLTSLQQENALLRTALSSSKDTSDGTKFKEFDSTIQSLNNRLDSTEERLEKAVYEKDDLLTQKTKLEGDITLIKCTLSSTRGELERFQLQRVDMLTTIKDLREALRIEREKKRKDTFDQEFPLMLPQNDDKGKKSPLDPEDSGLQLSLLQDLQTAKNQIAQLESQIRRAKEESFIYRKQLEGVSGSSSIGLNQVESLESALTEERFKIQEERATLYRLQSENSKLKRELQEAREHSEKSEYTDHYYQAKIKSIHEQHDEATAKLVSYEELLGTKNDEIARLKKEMGQVKAQLAELKSEGETIAVLRAQVEVYQADFRAEREARESLANDREKLRDEVRHLHARNTQLVDELEAYQRGHFLQGRNSRSGSTEPPNLSTFDQMQQPPISWEKFSSAIYKKEEGEKPSKKEDTPEVDENLLYCPKCNKTFTELRPLEEHVNRCLDED